MPEYLSPGVYIEEFEIGAKPIEGVSTSTVGMVGLTARGRASGLPELVTSFTEFQRKFGGYLGTEHGSHRYLPYCVEAFFNNGGQRAYIMRILRKDADFAEKVTPSGVRTCITRDTPEVKEDDADNEAARKKVTIQDLRGIDNNSTLIFEALNEFGAPVSGHTDTVEVDSYDPLRKTVMLHTALSHQYLSKNTRVTVDKDDVPPSITFTATDKGSWGNAIRIEPHPVSQASSPILEVIGEDTDASKTYRLKSASGFYIGAVVQFEDEENGVKSYSRIKEISSNTITLEHILNSDNTGVTDTDIPPKRKLSTCEFRLTVSYNETTEVYDFLTTNPVTPNYYYKKIHNISKLIDVNNLYPEAEDYTETAPFDQPSGENGRWISLAGGVDGTQALTSSDYTGDDGQPHDPGTKKGIMALEDIDDISIIAVPVGFEDSEQLKVQNALITQCERLKDRFAILDPPSGKEIAGIQQYRSQYSSQYAALYYPWLKVADPLDKIDLWIPPSGAVAGIYARTDANRGVHKAPANEKINGALDVQMKIGKGEQDVLNPRGINCIRTFPGRGQIVWGARTISDNTLWKYVNVRRLFNFIEESIQEGTQWVVFEPNDEKLWARVRATITQFLTRVWMDGALMGKKPEEAFFVKCDRTTMSQDDIDNGRLICVIGIAPVKPAEFVIFRIAQWQGGSAVTE